MKSFSKILEEEQNSFRYSDADEATQVKLDNLWKEWDSKCDEWANNPEIENIIKEYAMGDQGLSAYEPDVDDIELNKETNTWNMQLNFESYPTDEDAKVSKYPKLLKEAGSSWANETVFDYYEDGNGYPVEMINRVAEVLTKLVGFPVSWSGNNDESVIYNVAVTIK